MAGRHLLDIVTPATVDITRWSRAFTGMRDALASLTLGRLGPCLMAHVLRTLGESGDTSHGKEMDDAPRCHRDPL